MSEVGKTTRPLAVGDRAQNNEMPGVCGTVRHIEVVAEQPGYAVIAGKGWQTRIRLDRVKLDGKPRKSGWNRVEDAPDGK